MAEQRSILLRPRLDLGEGLSIGPGKIELLRALGRARSISAAAEATSLAPRTTASGICRSDQYSVAGKF